MLLAKLLLPTFSARKLLGRWMCELDMTAELEQVIE